jgi:hypothetical protein
MVGVLVGIDGWRSVGDLRCSWLVGGGGDSGVGEIWEMGGNFGSGEICRTTRVFNEFFLNFFF